MFKAVAVLRLDAVKAITFPSDADSEGDPIMNADSANTTWDGGG